MHTKVLEVAGLVKKGDFLILSECIVNDMEYSIIDKINLEEDNDKLMSAVREPIRLSSKFNPRVLYFIVLHTNLLREEVYTKNYQEINNEVLN